MSVQHHFTCPITREFIEYPVFCSCGHVFESAALYSWLDTNNICPVSRSPLRPQDIIYIPYIRKFLQAVKPSQDIQTQTDEIQTSPEINNARPPFLYTGNDPDHIPAFTDYIADGRIVHLRDGLFNLASSNAHVGPTVEHLNTSFINTLIDQTSTNAIIVVRKYLYNSHSTSLVYVARELARQGYFIFDIFLYVNRGDIKTYCIYSCDIKKDGSPNHLSHPTKLRHL
jgi:hypothetical protein